MIRQIEIDIQKLLYSKKQIQAVSDLLWKKWKDANFDLVSVNSFCSFLFEIQDWKKLISISITQLSKNAPVPWDFLAEALTRIQDAEIRQKVLKACLTFFHDPKNEPPFLKTYVFDAIYPQVSEWRSFYLNNQKRKSDEVRTTLMNQLNMFKHSMGFSEYEKQIINRIEKMYPNDSEVLKVTEGHKIKEFKEILKKYGKHYITDKSPQAPELKTEFKFKNILLNDCKKLLRDPNNSPYDFVFMFLFIEAYEEAIEILERIPRTSDHDWLMMELLMLAKKYTQALSWTDFLEENYPNLNEIENLSQIYYNRARCLWELNQKHLAIETIEYLLKWNPEYRIAHHLHYEWKLAI